MHYPHYTWETFYWKHEISELISQLGWWYPALFAYDLLGTFELFTELHMMLGWMNLT